MYEMKFAGGHLWAARHGVGASRPGEQLAIAADLMVCAATRNAPITLDAAGTLLDAAKKNPELFEALALAARSKDATPAELKMLIDEALGNRVAPPAEPQTARRCFPNIHQIQAKMAKSDRPAAPATNEGGKPRYFPNIDRLLARST